MNGAGPFSPRTILALLVLGSTALLLFLYALGQGWTGREERDGGAHAAAPGLNGFAALATLLDRRGYVVTLSRNRGRLDDEALLVLTPQHSADAQELRTLLAQRRHVGPTLLILPKWHVAAVSPTLPAAQPGWVTLEGAGAPDWLGAALPAADLRASIDQEGGWRGLGRSGRLPSRQIAQAVEGPGIVPLVRSAGGAVLAGYVEDGGYYPVLAEAAGNPQTGEDQGAWPVVIVAEPDLLDNHGLADRERAALALALVETTLEGYDLPIIFDLTQAGLGQTDNLLTLAFRPPFLAATLCLLLAALGIGWRAFHRFGPAVAALPEARFGKALLVVNGAALIERTGRLHLLGHPFATLVMARIAAQLGIRQRGSHGREEAVARHLARSDRADDFIHAMAALRSARKATDLLRTARSLQAIEKDLKR